MASHKKASQIVTPTAEELQDLFNLSPGPESETPRSEHPQTETLADPEAWVRDFLSDLESPPIDDFDECTGRPLNPDQRKSAIAEKQRQMLRAALPAAICALRKKLGKSQWEMVIMLGLGSMSCYVNWEHGRTVPSGAAMLMILRLCPDAESLANFGLNVSRFL